jgi:hypothetical protein
MQTGKTPLARVASWALLPNVTPRGNTLAYWKLETKPAHGLGRVRVRACVDQRATLATICEADKTTKAVGFAPMRWAARTGRTGLVKAGTVRPFKR